MSGVSWPRPSFRTGNVLLIFNVNSWKGNTDLASEPQIPDIIFIEIAQRHCTSIDDDSAFLQGIDTY